MRTTRFNEPAALAQWHREHVNTTEDDDYREIGNARCPWCSCRIYRGYHERGCPVRDILVAEGW